MPLQVEVGFLESLRLTSASGVCPKDGMFVEVMTREFSRVKRWHLPLFKSEHQLTQSYRDAVEHIALRLLHSMISASD